MNTSALAGRPVIFGEILWDEFADGTRTLGGAPFNVAWHLQGFGLQPLLISRVGCDRAGDEALMQINAWGLDQSGAQRDAHHATGAVHVTLESGQPDFNILADRAFDYIESAAALRIVEGIRSSVLYHGSLVARAGGSREALTKLRSTLRLPTYVDVNLRAPWWDHALIWQVLRGARWAKMSYDELAEVNETPTLRNSPIAELARGVRDTFEFELLVASHGSQGTYFVSSDDTHWVAAGSVQHLVDTIGAGDALSAVVILGLQRGWSRTLTQQRATEFGGSICTVKGALHRHQSIYDRFLRQWNEPNHAH